MSIDMNRNEPVIVIAEAGVNHNGDVAIAKELVRAAAKAGADYVKFQTFKTASNISKTAPKARYQIETTGKEETQYQMVKKLELSDSEHTEIYKECNNANIKFLSTPFDVDSLDLLLKLGLPMLKIASGELTNLPLLRAYASRYSSLGRPVLLSTGMANLEEISKAVNALTENGVEKEHIVVLHCTTEYPAPFDEINLRALKSMSETLGLPVGYSDHSLGVEVPIAAVTLGAKVIEKHFTLDKTSSGPDHRSSLEPDEFKYMVQCIRNIENALGDGVKRPSPSEKRNALVARKSIVASKNIKKGEVFSEMNITTKRPGTGLSPMYWDDVIGQKSHYNYSEDEFIKWQD
ncbi:N-acetylneuraminate synthase [Idiomarina sp. HP20-50]|uniref:N-acetylneuraminate synthase n=1 Tax=Idiomarina sp. HP20-50 TaxID=3070813 RepID=UPI00294B4428|nr:N-acetylneuraminate synthase [Idiomarina sp. HP20-50]MDV6316965.1 N-acetylneuraminate synthase [Idiomarina sp. HP20-50]